MKKTDREVMHILVHYPHSSLRMKVLLSPFYSEERETGRGYVTSCLGRADKEWSS